MRQVGRKYESELVITGTTSPPLYLGDTTLCGVAIPSAWTAANLVLEVALDGLRAQITGATKANPVVITAPAHGFSDADVVFIDEVVGMTELNGRVFTVANKTADTFELSGEDGTSHTAFVRGGAAYRHTWLTLPTTDGVFEVAASSAQPLDVACYVAWRWVRFRSSVSQASPRTCTVITVPVVEREG